MTPTISAIVIAKNEEAMIANCLDTLRWCDEVVVVNNDSSDATVGIAHRQGARVITTSGTFAELRNEALKRSKTDWVLYVDADERVTPALAQEIKKVIDQPEHVAYAVNRTNVLYGQHLQHGGWGEDWVVRLFERTKLKTWAGEVHEHAEVDGSEGKLSEKLVHFTHRDIISGLIKTAHWTPIEASLLAASSKTPKVTLGLILRKTLMELVRRLITKQGYKDGLTGWIEALVQAMNRMLVYMQVWELQQKPSLPEKYQQYERSIVELWKRAS
jgi:glycosyltransferase involved in cell wall biosynthesis